MSATGSTLTFDREGGAYPIRKFADGTFNTAWIALSSYATASATDPGTPTKTANLAGVTAWMEACKAAKLPGLVDGQFFVNGHYALFGFDFCGRNPQIDPTYTGAIMDGIIGDDDTSGSPRVGCVLGNDKNNPTKAHETNMWGVHIGMVGWTVRAASFGQYGLSPNLMTGKIFGCLIDGGMGLVAARSCRRLWIRGTTVARVFADGIHVAGGAKDVLVENNWVEDCQDDMYACVGNTLNNAGDIPNTDFTYRHNGGRKQTVGGAGVFRVAGGSNVLIEDNGPFTNYRAAAYMLNVDSGYGTRGNRNITARRGFFSDPNTTVQPAIRIFGLAGVDADGVPLTSDGVECTDNFYGNTYYRRAFLGNDADADAYTKNTTIMREVGTGNTATPTAVGENGYFASLDGLRWEANRFTGGNAQAYSLTSTNGRNTGNWTLKDSISDTFNTGGGGSNDFILPAAGCFGTLLPWNIQISGMQALNTTFERWIESGANIDADAPANTPGRARIMHYKASDCVSTPVDKRFTLTQGDNWDTID